MRGKRRANVTAWPSATQDGQPLSTAAGVDAVSDDLATHEARTDNPHAVTAAQTGGLTIAQVLARISFRG